MNAINPSHLTGQRKQGAYIINAYQKMFGISVSKTWEELFQLEACLNEWRPERVVELGTGTGATTMFMALCRCGSMNIYTFDRTGPGADVQKVFRRLDVAFWKENIFDADMVSLIDQMISQAGCTLLYCDNGDKKRELKTFAPYLKPGDIALVHDYGEEIFEADLDAACRDFGMAWLDRAWFEQFTGMHRALVKK